MKKALFFVLTFICLSTAMMAQTDSLQQYLGKYKFPDGSPVTEIAVTLESGVLTATSAMGNSELRKTQGDVFDIVAFGGTATFKRNTEGKVIAVQIAVGDVNMEGTKTDGAIVLLQKLVNQPVVKIFTAKSPGFRAG